MDLSAKLTQEAKDLIHATWPNTYFKPDRAYILSVPSDHGSRLAGALAVSDFEHIAGHFPEVRIFKT